ncbi:MAG: hypothetical protein ACOCYT_00475 [Chloroflexota bacterium]
MMRLCPLTQKLGLIVLALGLALGAIAAPLLADSRGRITADPTAVTTYPLTAAAGDTVTVRITRLSGVFTPAAGIADADGRIIARPEADGIQADRVELSHTFLTSGEYTIQVGRLEVDDSQAVGEFIIDINQTGPVNSDSGEADTAPPARVTLITSLPQTLGGRIDDASPQQLYYVYLETAERITGLMTRTSGDLSVGLAVVNSEGRAVARGTPDDERAQVSYRAGEAGWYAVGATRIDPEQQSSGDYRLYLTGG